MNIEKVIKLKTVEGVKYLYKQELTIDDFQTQATRKDFEGDFTITVFGFLKFSRKSPEDTANEIGEYLKTELPEILSFNVVKGFLNITIDSSYWISLFNEILKLKKFGFKKIKDLSSSIMIEFSSPNTNKPLHLGHVRNNMLGNSISEILKASGKNVTKVNLVNDRGIHICKSMLAWQKWSNNETPETNCKKGDHLVGDYYVKFNDEYKKQTKALLAQGMKEEEAKNSAPILLEAKETLRKWEAKDEETINLWKKMNEWVYDGFNKTYKKLGIKFDKTYYESKTYELGKSLIFKALEKGILLKKEDGSVWADLSEFGLDQKLLLRSDGTSVYITQDIGTAHQRFSSFSIDKHFYVVGNEQNYHFQVLKLILKQLGFDWAENIEHLSYGMVELPSGKMKSREGTVVDADDLMEEMKETATNTSVELGKLENFNEFEKKKIIESIAIGALKYFILKVDPKKNMTFNPKESIDFNGNTGPFIQYTYVRIQSVLDKAKSMEFDFPKETNIKTKINSKEIELIKLLSKTPSIINDSAQSLNPAIIANFCYNLAKEYNQFYHEFPIISEIDDNIRNFRLNISLKIAKSIKNLMGLLGIDVPQRM
ncbi:MAG: arginine--tRNA ligase [Bacteroidetes bacterium]|nr:arginine--tRNA ligase [Bacteroidota bacterium]MBT6685999.1 arginine--tRNA ligase [Bacteroidota bacterium]MBT7143781.1 arginine--tRNA ligase [Bacteroidota bacterium]MBT7490880.1 arginine--tRNA ligase [Bacteroidota bacterium]